MTPLVVTCTPRGPPHLGRQKLRPPHPSHPTPGGPSSSTFSPLATWAAADRGSEPALGSSEAATSRSFSAALQRRRQLRVRLLIHSPLRNDSRRCRCQHH